MWALGAAAADDLLNDLCRAAQRHAARTGAEASPVELLDALGHHHHAATLNKASARGLVEHDEATAHVRAQRAVHAARAIVRLVQVDHHRRGAATGWPASSAPPDVSARPGAPVTRSSIPAMTPPPRAA